MKPIDEKIVSIANEKQKTKRIVIYILIFFFVWTIRVVSFNVFDKNISTDDLRLFIGTIFRFLVWVLPVIIYLKYVDKTDSNQYLKLSTNLKKGLYWSVGVIVVVIILGSIAFSALNLEIKNSLTISIFINWILFVAIFEEILMRGFILNKLIEIMPFTKALIITSLLFVLIHWPGWILIYTYSFTWMLNTSIYIFALAIFLGLLVKKSESLYPSIVLHALNDIISLSLN